MARTFNCGIGMVAVVAPRRGRGARAPLDDAGERVVEIGRIVKRHAGEAGRRSSRARRARGPAEDRAS